MTRTLPLVGIALLLAAGLGFVALGGMADSGGDEGARATARDETGLTRRASDVLGEVPGARAVTNVRAGARTITDGRVDEAQASPRYLDASFQLVGRAVDTQTAEPLVGAELFATTTRSDVPLGLELMTTEGERSRVPSAQGLVTVSSDVDGRLSVPVAGAKTMLGPGEPLRALLRRQGYVPARLRSQTLSIFPPHDIGTVPMHPAQSVVGKIVGPDGAAIVGASVSFGQPERRGFMAREAPTRGLFACVSDSEGRYQVNELRAGEFWIIVSAKGFPVRRVEGSTRAGDKPLTLDVQLERGVRISGAIKGAPGDRDLVVVATGQESRDDTGGGDVPLIERRGRTMEVQPYGDRLDARQFAGEAFVRGIEYRLSVMVRNPVTGALRRTRAVERVVVPAGTETVELQWRERTKVVGQVVAVRASGDDVHVEAFMVARADGHQNGVDFDAASLQGANGEALRKFPGGRFIFDDLDRRGRGKWVMTFRVRAVGYEDLFVRGVEVKVGETTDLGRLLLAPGETIAVHVVDGATGVPVDSAHVFVASSESDRWLNWWRKKDSPAWESDTVRYGETTASGHALVQRPPGGNEFKIAVNADGFAPSDVLTRVVPAGANSAGVVEVELSRGASVIARVVEEGGPGPVAGATVELVLQDGFVRGKKSLLLQTDALGIARFDAVPAGEATLRIKPPTLHPRNPRAWKRAKAIEFEVPALGEVEHELVAMQTIDVVGRVIELGAPLADARISFEVVEGRDVLRSDYRGDDLRAISGADGSFRVPCVPSGTYSVVVGHRTRAMFSRFDVTLEGGTEDELILRLPEVIVEGRVVDARSGAPVGGIRVSVSGRNREGEASIGRAVMEERADGSLGVDADWFRPGRKRTGGNGKFSFRGVEVGRTLEVTVSGEFIRFKRVRVDVLGPGQTKTLPDIKVQAAGSLRVNVAGERWRAERRRLTVELVQLDRSGNATGRPNEQRGRRRPRFASLAPGKYRVTLTRRVDGSKETIEAVDVQVKARQTARVTLTLP